MEFASEMVVRSALEGLDIREVPTTLSVDGRSRPPHLRTWRDGWRHLRFLLLYSPRWLLLIPGLLLLGLGLLGMLALLPGPVQVLGLEFDIHALIYMHLAIVIGTQLIFLAAFVRVYMAGTGLLPNLNRASEKLEQSLTLERVLVVGLLMVVIGGLGSVLAIIRWGGNPIESNQISQMMRLVLPSVTAVAIGLEAVFAAFVLGVLRLEISH